MKRAMQYGVFILMDVVFWLFFTSGCAMVLSIAARICSIGWMWFWDYERRERLDVGEWYCKVRNGLSFSFDACPFRQKVLFLVKLN